MNNAPKKTGWAYTVGQALGVVLIVAVVAFAVVMLILAAYSAARMVGLVS